MVSYNRIRCTVVAVPVDGERWASRGALAKDLLPWADPYVARLIKNLQDEVRRERRMRSLVRHYRPTTAQPGAHDRFEAQTDYNTLGGDGSSQCDTAW